MWISVTPADTFASYMVKWQNMWSHSRVYTTKKEKLTHVITFPLHSFLCMFWQTTNQQEFSVEKVVLFLHINANVHTWEKVNGEGVHQWGVWGPAHKDWKPLQRLEVVCLACSDNFLVSFVWIWQICHIFCYDRTNLLHRFVSNSWRIISARRKL